MRSREMYGLQNSGLDEERLRRADLPKPIVRVKPRGSTSLTALQREFLVQLYELVRRYEAGDWDFGKSTIWSRLLYELARARGKLKPSPVAGRYNTTRGFEQQVSRAAAALVKRKLCVWKSIRTAQDAARSVQGYKRHRARDKDIFLTGVGIEQVRDLLRGQGRWAEDGVVACDDVVSPRAPMATGRSGCDE